MSSFFKGNVPEPPRKTRLIELTDGAEFLSQIPSYIKNNNFIKLDLNIEFDFFLHRLIQAYCNNEGGKKRHIKIHVSRI